MITVPFAPGVLRSCCLRAGSAWQPQRELKKTQLCHWSQLRDKETTNGPSGTQLPFSITHVPQALVSCARVCLARG